MKDKIALAIVALMITSLAYALSTTSVSATHDPPTVTITVDDLTVVKADVSKTYKLTVTNTGGHAIDNVTVAPHGSFTGFVLVWAIGKDNVLYDNNNDNIVMISANTTVMPSESENAILRDNTIVLKKAGENLWITGADGVYRKAENFTLAKIKIRSGNGYPLENTLENILTTDNLVLLNDVRVTMCDNRLKLTKDVDVENLADNVVKLIENAAVKIVIEDVLAENRTRDNIYWENFKIVRETHVTLIDNAEGRAVLAEDLVADIPGIGTGQTIPAGRYVLLDNVLVGNDNCDNRVYLQVDTIIQLRPLIDGDNSIGIKENTIVTKENASKLFFKEFTLADKTPGWTGDATYKRWTTTTGAKMIAMGVSESFYFALTSPSTEGDYTFIVTTEDNVGGPNNIRDVEVKVSVDATKPYTKSITAPKWAKGTENVTITVVMSEVISPKETWVVVTENNGENVRVAMTTTDNIIWTGTYLTTDNALRDGVAQIFVKGDNYLDRVKWTGLGDNTDNFKCDRRAPPRPTAAAPYYLTSLPPKTNQGSWTISGEAVDTRYDNNLLDNLCENIEGMKVLIRAKDVTFEAWSGAAGDFSRVISLSEGKNEVGVKIIDLAGNEGLENVQTVFYDATKPVITPVSIAGITYSDNMHIKENKPTIVLKIYDPGYDDNTDIATGCGVDNRLYVAATHTGFRVELWSDGPPENALENLSNAKPWSKVTGDFENTIAERSDGWYKIKVIAGDNLQSSDVKTLRFKIDTIKPAAPSLEVRYPASTRDAPKIMTTTTISLGGTGEAGFTIKVYKEGVYVPEADTTVGTDGTWRTSVTVTAGVVTKIEVTQTDIAGNESDKYLYGYVMTDATAPEITAVTVDGVAYTVKVSTDKSRVVIAGKVTDEVSKYYEIELRMDYAGTTVVLAIGADGSFSKDVPLAEGSNIITLKAKDAAGNVTPATTLEVERTVTPMGTYAIILVIIALVLAAIAIVRRR